MFDLIVRNCRIVTAAEVLPLGVEIGVKDGKIAVLGTGLTAGADTDVVDAEGAYVTPGGVDSHAHIEQANAPTGDTWETGTRSAVAGGNTTVLAFASQGRSEASVWPCIAAYAARAQGHSHCDYGLHLIVTNAAAAVVADELPALAARAGIASIKLYMTYDALQLGDGDVFRVLLAARAAGLATMVHAENHDLIAAITARLAARGRTQTHLHAVARPQIAEAEATYRAISLAEVADAPLLLVHMSAPVALEHVRAAQARLLPIHAETCPHYLYLLSERLRSTDGAAHGLADPADASTHLASGTYTVVSSDHAPSVFDHADGKKRGLVRDPASGRLHADFRRVPNGLPGIETRLPLLFHRTFDPTAPPGTDAGAATDPATGDVRISLPRFVALTSTNPAQLYGLADRKGSLQPGLDADIVVWHPAGFGGVTIRNAALHHAIDYTPFEGMEVRNWPRLVFLRGRRVWDRDGGGVLSAAGDGRFLARTTSRVLAGRLGQTPTGMAAGETAEWM